jgi:carbamoyltransferase|tara:strand:+ start:2842 stop:4104 length:1263 start_codon:yes stop_codon:yes gene_type:complete
MQNEDHEWVLSVSFAAHDGSITLLKDGKVELFIKEEKSSRRKHDSRFPFRCLQLIKEYTQSLDQLLVSNCSPWVNGDNKDYLKLTKFHVDKLLMQGFILDDSKTEYCEHHHLLHAACGFYTSGFDEAICLVCDGWGTTAGLVYDLDNCGINAPPIQATESMSTYHASFPSNFVELDKTAIYDSHRCDGLHELQKFHARSGNNQLPSVKDFLSSIKNTETTSHMGIGVMYGVVSASLGFDNIDCGKTMGLSAYGEEDDSIPPFFVGDTLKSNKNFFTQSRTLDFANYNAEDIISSEEKRANLAYKMQKSLEKIYEHKIKFIDDNYECKNIVLSGGCALNVVNNAALVEKFPHINFFVDPVPNDAGQSLGHALLWNYENGPCAVDNVEQEFKIESYDNLFLGPIYSKEELRDRINSKILEDV